MSISPLAIAATLITLLFLGLTIGNSVLTNQFIKTETLDIQTDRVINGIAGMESVPKGYIQMEMEGYGIKVDSGNISMNYSGSNISRDLTEEPIDSTVAGPQKFQDIEENLCIIKRENEILIDPGEC